MVVSAELVSHLLEEAGFMIEAIREVTENDPHDRWHRVPLFLHLRALLLAAPTAGATYLRAAGDGRVQRVAQAIAEDVEGEHD